LPNLPVGTPALDVKISRSKESAKVVRPKMDLFPSEAAKSEDAARRGAHQAENLRLIRALETGEAFRYLRQSPLEFALESSAIKKTVSEASCSAEGLSVRDTAKVQAYVKAYRVRQARFDRELENLRRVARAALRELEESGSTTERGLIAISTAAVLAGSEASRELEAARRESARMEAARAAIEDNLRRARAVSVGLAENAAVEEELRAIARELKDAEIRLAEAQKAELDRARERTAAVRAELSAVAEKHPALRPLVQRLSEDPEYLPDPNEVDSHVSRPARLLARKLVSELNRRRRESRALARLSAPENPDDERDALRELELLRREEERENASTPWVAQKLRRKNSKSVRGNGPDKVDSPDVQGGIPTSGPSAADVGLRTEFAAAQARAESLAQQLSSVQDLARKREQDLERSLAEAQFKLAERDAEIARLRNAFEEEKRKALLAKEQFDVDVNQRTKNALEELHREMTRALEDADRRARESRLEGRREGFEEGRRKGLAQAAERNLLFGGLEKERNEAERAAQTEARKWAEDQLRAALEELERARASAENANRRILEEQKLRREAEEKLAPLQAQVQSRESELQELRRSLAEERERHAREIDQERKARIAAEERVEQVVSGQRTVAKQAELEATKAALSVALAESESLRDQLAVATLTAPSKELESLRLQLSAAQENLSRVEREARVREAELVASIEAEKARSSRVESSSSDRAELEELRAAKLKADEELSSERGRRSSLERNLADAEAASRSKMESVDRELARERELRSEAEKRRAGAEAERDAIAKSNAEAAARARATVMRERDAAVARAREASDKLARESEEFGRRAERMKQDVADAGRREQEAKERVLVLTEELAKSRAATETEKTGRIRAENYAREVLREAVAQLENLSEQKALLEDVAIRERQRSEKLGDDLQRTTKARIAFEKRAQDLDVELRQSRAATDNVETVALNAIDRAEKLLQERERKVREKEEELERLRTQHEEALRRAGDDARARLDNQSEQSREERERLRRELDEALEAKRVLEERQRLSILDRDRLLEEANRAKQELQDKFDAVSEQNRHATADAENRLQERIRELETKLEQSERRATEQQVEFERRQQDKESQLKEVESRLKEEESKLVEARNRLEQTIRRQRQAETLEKDSSAITRDKVRQETEKLNAEIEKQRRTLENSEAQRQKLANDLDRTQRELDALKATPKSPSQKENVERLQQELQDANERNRTLQTQLEDERLQNRRAISDREAQLETQIRSLNAELAAARKDDASRTEQRSKLDDELVALREQLSELKDAAAERDKLRAQLDAARDSLVRSQTDVTSVERSSRQDREKLQAEIDSLRERLSQAERAKRDADALQSELRQKQDRVLELEREAAATALAEQKLRESQGELEAKVQLLETRLQDAAQERTDAETKLQLAERRLRDLTDQFSSTDRTLTARQKELEVEVQRLQNESIEKTRRSEELAQSLRAELQREREQLEQLKRDVEVERQTEKRKREDAENSLRQRLTEYESELFRLRESSGNLESKLTDSEAKLVEEKRTLSARISNLETELRAEQQKVADQEWLKTELAQAREELRERHKAAEKSDRELAETKQLLERQLDEAKTIQAKLDATAKTLIATQQLVSQGNITIQGQLKAAEELNSEITSLRSRLQQYENQPNALEVAAHALDSWLANTDLVQKQLSASDIADPNLRSSVQNVVNRLNGLREDSERERDQLVAQLNRQLVDKDQALADAEASKQAEASKYEALAASKTKLEQELHQLRNEHKELQGRHKRRLDELESYKASLKTATKSAQEVGSLKTAKQELEKEVLKLKESNDELAQELAALQRTKSEDAVVSARTVAAYDAELVRLKEAYEQELETRDRKLAAIAQNFGQLAKKLKHGEVVDKMQGVNSYQSVDMLLEEIKKLQEEIEGQEAMVSQLSNEDARRLPELERENQQLLESNQRLQTTLEQLRRDSGDLLNYVSTWDENTARNADPERTTLGQQAVDNHLLKVVDKVRSAYDGYREAFAERNQVLNLLSGQNLTHGNGSLETQVRTILEERSKLSQELETANSANLALRQELVNLTEQASQQWSGFEAERTQDRENLKKAEDELAAEKAKQVEFSLNASQTVDALNQQLETERQKFSSLEEQLIQERAQTQNLQHELAVAQENIRTQLESWKNDHELLAVANQTIASLQGQLDDVKRDLQTERQLRATAEAKAAADEVAKRSTEQQLSDLNAEANRVHQMLLNKLSALYGYNFGPEDDTSFETLLEYLDEGKQQVQTDTEGLLNLKSEAEIRRLSGFLDDLNARFVAQTQDLGVQIDDNAALFAENELLRAERNALNETIEKQKRLIATTEQVSNAWRESNPLVAQLQTQVSELQRSQAIDQQAGQALLTENAQLRSENARLQRFQQDVTQQQNTLQSQQAILQNMQVQIATKDLQLAEAADRQNQLQVAVTNLQTNTEALQFRLQKEQDTFKEFLTVLGAKLPTIRNPEYEDTTVDYAQEALTAIDLLNEEHTKLVDTLVELGKTARRASLASEAWMGASALLANLDDEEERQVEFQLQSHPVLREWWKQFKSSKNFLLARIQTARPEEQEMNEVHAEVVSTLRQLEFEDLANEVERVRMSGDPTLNLAPNLDTVMREIQKTRRRTRQ
jgi:hypothetical protein